MMPCIENRCVLYVKKHAANPPPDWYGAHSETTGQVCCAHCLGQEWFNLGTGLRILYNLD